MSYLTTQDLTDELGEATLIKLTDDEGTGEINETRVLKAVEFASGTFDAYARSRYSLPVPATPLVKATCLDLAIFHLYKSRGSFAKGGVYEIRESNYKAALSLLKDMQAGRASLDVPAADETVDLPATSDRVLTNVGRTKFTDEKLAGF